MLKKRLLPDLKISAMPMRPGSQHGGTRQGRPEYYKETGLQSEIRGQKNHDASVSWDSSAEGNHFFESNH